MTYLLDISALIAGLWQNHPANPKVTAWFRGKQVATCPISELGFLRISSNPRGPIRASLSSSQRLLQAFIKSKRCEFLADDISALLASSNDSEGLTEAYLGELAARHSMKLATLDSKTAHPASELIS